MLNAPFNVESLASVSVPPESTSVVPTVKSRVLKLNRPDDKNNVSPTKSSEISSVPEVGKALLLQFVAFPKSKSPSSLSKNMLSTPGMVKSANVPV